MNEMKQRINWLLMVVMLFSVSTVVTSCKDDKDDGNEPTPEEKETDARDLDAMSFWTVAGQLSSGCDETADWRAARLTANIGEASEQSDATRLILVNDADAALARFAALIGTEVPDYTVSYDWTLDGAGSLTYRKQNDGTAWATVDVDLKRLVYCSPEQQGLNARFEGTAYYRFGDVIRKKNDDGNWDYWICVRPMFSKEKKQDMHWVTLSDLPTKNVLRYDASTKDIYYLPTKISGSYSKIHWQNAAETLFAILHPQQWRDNLDNTANKKLGVFNDFSRTKINYHNQYFWQRVQNGWQKHDLFETLLHFDRSVLTSDMKSIRFIYYGYSWRWTLSWDLTLWAQEYGGMDNNFHTFKALEKTENVKNKPFNVHLYGKNGEHSDGYVPFPRFTYPCRYSTGKALAGFSPSEYTTMASTANGIEDVYVYNTEYGIVPGRQTDPEECTKNMLESKDE